MIDTFWTGRGPLDGTEGDSARMIERAELWTQEVRDTVPAQRLLVWEPKDGWEPLCEFIGVDVPAEELPRVNDTDAFRGIMGGAVAALNGCGSRKRLLRGPLRRGVEANSTPVQDSLTRAPARTYHPPVERDPRQIVAFGGGGFSMEPGNTLLDDYVLSITGSARPKVCFLPTASGDADHYIVRFYRAFDPAFCEPSHLSLFRREQAVGDAREHLLTRDLIYVGGGSVISLLGTWRAHGIDEILREAWERGVVLCGLSAGSLCWFAESITAFHGPPRQVTGLGFLPWSNCVHFDADPQRCAAYRSMLAGGMAPGYAAEDGSALHFEGERLARVVSSRQGARAHSMRWTGKRVSRRPLNASYLGAAETTAAAQPAGRLSVVAA